MALPKIERRTVGGVIELRAEPQSSAEGRLIVGYASVFDSVADIGWFREVVQPGAFAKAILRDDVRALINHDRGLVLGRNKAGTLRMTEDARGLRCEIDVPDTQYARDLMVSMDRGDITQMSFGFEAVVETWDDSGEAPLRTLVEVGLFDVSVVTYPAYEDTEAEASGKRSFDLWRAANPIAPTAPSAADAARLRMKRAQAERLPSRL
jgi:HK97 family phage prohead protease